MVLRATPGYNDTNLCQPLPKRERNVTRVLLIDDDKNYHTLTQLMLARAAGDSAYTVDWVGSYAEGLRAVLDGVYDIYLVDYHLGPASGLDLVREALRRGVTAPLVILTGQGEHNVDVAAMQAGAADYIDKAELKAPLLERALRYALERSRAVHAQKRYIEQLMLLRQVDDELSRITDIDSVLVLALDAASRLSQADSGFIALVDEGKVRLAQAIGQYSGLNDADTDASLNNAPLLHRLLDDREPRLLTGAAAGQLAPLRHDGSTPGDVAARMLLPMLSYERLVGVMNLETKHADRFSEEVYGFIQLISARAAVAVENAQLYAIAQTQLAQLQQLYEQVSALEQLKTDMIRIAAHDLRNPVNVIVGYVGLLQWELKNALSDKQARYLQSIEESAHQMEKITTDILSLERIQNMQDGGTHERVDLKATVQQVFREYELQAVAKGQQYNLHLPDGDVMVEADGAQLREAAVNLISNAHKYTPEGGSIDVTLDVEGGQAVYTVVDTGYGIPLHQQASLFQPFFRARSQQTAGIEGTGLGLHLVKNIVERADGRMIFESEEGVGSTFGFRLPLIVAEAAP